MEKGLVPYFTASGLYDLAEWTGASYMRLKSLRIKHLPHFLPRKTPREWTTHLES